LTDLQAQVLRRLRPFQPPQVLVGTSRPDDAGVYLVRKDLGLILTVDFFTPVVDDPRTYGEIAAANSLSDVYAMGGEPFAALNIVAFPAASAELPLSVLGDILEGGEDKAREAGVAIVGGHTVDDSEPKYGLAVVGRIDPARIVTKGGARPGDVLVLTKPIGTGLLTTALKQGKRTEADLAEAVRVMRMLNRDACRAMAEAGATAATDVTGYGLLGHLGEMLAAGDVGARLSMSAVPVLEGARRLAEEGVAPGGTRKNLAAAAATTTWGEGVDEADRLLLADAQTSGGLLIAVPAASCDLLVARLRELDTPAAAILGEVRREPGLVVTR
jgi:selenide,water dikinase